jgi:hypothetical protein
MDHGWSPNPPRFTGLTRERHKGPAATLIARKDEAATAAAWHPNPNVQWQLRVWPHGR